MKKFFKYILLAAAALCLGANAANAADLYYEGGSTGLRRWFTWHWDYANNQPMTGAKGLLMINAVTDSHVNNEVFVHVVKDGTRYRFYCDEECKVECIGLGVTNSWNDFAILWKGVYNCNNEVGHSQNGFVYEYTISEDSPSISSPKDITEFLYMITNAAAAMQKNMNELPSDSHAPHVKNLITTTNGSSTDLQIHFCLHNTYELTSAESRYAISDFESGDSKVKSIDFGRAYVIYDGVVQYPRKIYFERSADFVGSDSDNALLSINPKYDGGASASDTYYINFSLGHASSRVEIDNKTSNESDVAVRVNHNGLFMMQNVTIKNSVSGNDGVGVKLASGGEYNYHNAAVELGNDQSGLGNAAINGQHIGIDAYAGVIRLKRTAGGVLNGNDIAASIEHGVMLGKWADDISSFTGNDVLITLKNPDEWRAGDIVFASGRTKVPNGNLSNVANEYYAFLTTDDGDHLQYAPATDLSKRFRILFDRSGTPENVDYEYPVFRLDLQCIYNPRTKMWYNSLYDALNDSGDTLNGQNKAIADGDELIYFGNVLEPKAVTVNNNIFIRSAYRDHDGDRQAATDSGRDPDSITSNYKSTYAGTDQTFITVAEGKTLTIGNRTGSSIFSDFTIDMNGKGRALDVFGRVNMYGQYPSGVGLSSSQSIINGYTSGNGGAIKIESTGTLDITNVVIRNNTADGNGAAIYQGGTMYISETPSFDNSDYVYLPESHVITKAGIFSVPNEKPIPVKLANEASGRDILVSMEGASNSLDGQVESSDRDKLSVSLEDLLFEVVYNATGFDGGSYFPTDVIELFLGNGKIKIIKDGLKTGDSAVFTVTAADSENPSYTIVLTGIDDSGSQVQQAILEVPINTYTVTESGWSWAYSGTNSSITKSIAESQAVGVFSEFRFSNEAKSGTTEHAESSKNNEFN